MLKSGFKYVLMWKVTSQILVLWCVSVFAAFFNNGSNIPGYKFYLNKKAHKYNASSGVFILVHAQVMLVL